MIWLGLAFFVAFFTLACAAVDRDQFWIGFSALAMAYGGVGLMLLGLRA